jgi:hypothetical protein
VKRVQLNNKAKRAVNLFLMKRVQLNNKAKRALNLLFCEACASAVGASARFDNATQGAVPDGSCSVIN